MTLLLLLACSTPAPAPAPATDAPAAPAGEDAPQAPLQVSGSRNRAPTVKGLRITPDGATVKDELVASAEIADEDGDPLRSSYTWYINDQEVDNVTLESLAAGRAKRGDKVRVKLVVDDGNAPLEAVSSPITIQNIPPVMQTDPQELTRMDGFQMRAEDPDGEDLTWSLSGGPEGMSISPTGMLRYRGSETEPGGDYTVHIEARDAGGATAGVEVGIHVNPGSAAPKPEKAEKSE